MKSSKLFATIFLAAAMTPFAAYSAPTFNADIAPIIYQNCSSCHRPGEAAPFSLLSYHDAVRKARMIAKLTGSRTMPPWKAQAASYEYRDDRRLTDAQIALIQEWVAAGTPEGSGTAPEPPKFTSGWQLGEPDLIVEMPKGFHIPADGPDIYRNIPVPLGLTEDKWVTAIAMRPSARAVVHHVLYFADPNGHAHERPQQGDEPGFSGMRSGASVSLGGWAVGAQPHQLPYGLALRLPKGSDLVVQYHFHPDGKPEVEKSQVGFYFAKQPPTRTLASIQMPPHYSLFSGLDIPPGEKDFVIRDTYTLPVAIDGVGIGAHAHYLATVMKMTATLPGGDVKTLLNITDWDFAWQDRYYFKDLVALPQGTKLDVEIHWDNSAENPHNPSIPPVRVTWGEESKDEMGTITLIAVPHDEADSAKLHQDVNQRARMMAHEKMQSDPQLAKKVMKMLAE
ncbi:MAG TPA: cytochrome c [Verrucomicrobiae bacterium]|jgi:hypothetical protein|nr:cytochrome c [Verrucomicrobiae bacterium]